MRSSVYPRGNGNFQNCFRAASVVESQPRVFFPTGCSKFLRLSFSLWKCTTQKDSFHVSKKFAKCFRAVKHRWIGLHVVDWSPAAYHNLLWWERFGTVPIPKQTTAKSCDRNKFHWSITNTSPQIHPLLTLFSLDKRCSSHLLAEYCFPLWLDLPNHLWPIVARFYVHY